jgi:secondary thiamine-phosphate synthase enzyme
VGGIAVHLELTVKTTEREQFINITGKLNELLAKSGVRDGCCTVFVSHTTAALTVNEDADPDVMEDMLWFLQKTVPLRNGYRHREGNSDAHIKASLLGCSLHLIIKDGYFDLGTWQGVFLAEFDGPRSRTVKVWID